MKIGTRRDKNIDKKDRTLFNATHIQTFGADKRSLTLLFSEIISSAGLFVINSNHSLH